MLWPSSVSLARRSAFRPFADRPRREASSRSSATFMPLQAGACWSGACEADARTSEGDDVGFVLHCMPWSISDMQDRPAHTFGAGRLAAQGALRLRHEASRSRATPKPLQAGDCTPGGCEDGALPASASEADASEADALGSMLDRTCSSVSHTPDHPAPAFRASGRVARGALQPGTEAFTRSSAPVMLVQAGICRPEAALLVGLVESRLTGLRLAGSLRSGIHQAGDDAGLVRDPPI